MLPAAVTRAVTQDKVNETDYRISLVLKGSRRPRADAASFKQIYRPKMQDFRLLGI